ncbi:hypothetical protein ABPG73_001136 [Tetrahymena malaccensis]
MQASPKSQEGILQQYQKLILAKIFGGADCFNKQQLHHQSLDMIFDLLEIEYFFRDLGGIIINPFRVKSSKYDCHQLTKPIINAWRHITGAAISVIRQNTNPRKWVSETMLDQIQISLEKDFSQNSREKVEQDRQADSKIKSSRVYIYINIFLQRCSVKCLIQNHIEPHQLVFKIICESFLLIDLFSFNNEQNISNQQEPIIREEKRDGSQISKYSLCVLGQKVPFESSLTWRSKCSASMQGRFSQGQSFYGLSDHYFYQENTFLVFFEVGSKNEGKDVSSNRK